MVWGATPTAHEHCDATTKADAQNAHHIEGKLVSSSMWCYSKSGVIYAPILTSKIQLLEDTLLQLL